MTGPEFAKAHSNDSGTPRTDVYQQTVNHYFPHDNDLTVLFFDLQPNRI